MTARSRATRLGCLLTVVSIATAACGGGSEDDATPTGGAGQAGIVLDTAPEVESAVVEPTTTIPGEESATTVAPDPTTVPPPAPTTAPAAATTTTIAVPAPETTATPPEPPDTGSNGVPVGYRPIIDESGDLRANVPAEWVEIDGAPDGELRQLSAAPDLTGFLGGYSEPGMVLLTGAAATPDSWMDGLSTTLGVAEGDGCVVSETSDYSDGVYTGTEHILTCGSDASVAHLIGGRNSDGDLFFLLAIVRSVDEPDVRDQVVQSFFID